MLLTKEVETSWSPTNRSHYEELGYVYVWRGKFTVLIEHLPKNSQSKVNVKCDNCGEILIGMRWVDYIKYVHEDGKYYCNKCAHKLFAGENIKKTKLKNSKSFYQWCYNNLSEEYANQILSRWDYRLNVDKNGNVLTPKDVCFSSAGFNKKGYWFKCLEHPEHESELKDLNHFTSKKGGNINCFSCNQCNVVALTHPHLVKYFVNKEDAYKYSHGSRENILMKCPDCGCEKYININSLKNRGFGCSGCSDGVSYAEKLLFNVLKQVINNNFLTQLSKTTFKWCGKYKYDLYIDKIHGIVEAHGLQHYVESTGNWNLSLKGTQKK